MSQNMTENDSSDDYSKNVHIKPPATSQLFHTFCLMALFIYLFANIHRIKNALKAQGMGGGGP